MLASKQRSYSISRAAALCMASGLLGASAAAAVTPNGEVQARYEQERARCLSGQSGQAQSTCLKEAGAARDAALKGQLTDGDGKLKKNARDRCDVLTGDERRDCVSRAKGDANTSESGSVKGGGILKETTTIEPAAAPTAVPASAPSAP
jgi:hypothetical protein